MIWVLESYMLTDCRLEFHFPNAQSRTRLKRLSSSSSSMIPGNLCYSFSRYCIDIVQMLSSVDLSLTNHICLFTLKLGDKNLLSEVTQSCRTLCDPMDCSLPGSSVCGIFQARVLEWVAISFSRGSSQPKDWTPVSFIAGRLFTIWATREGSLGR